jgi:hypothetical protein
MEEEICCPKFDPQPWEEATLVWKDKLFITDTVKQCMHMPLPGQMAKVMTRMFDLTKKCGVEVTDMKEFMVLSYDPSPWKSIQYMAVSGDHPDLKNKVALSGTFLTKVFDGPYNGIPKYLKEMDVFVQKQGKTVKKYYFYYTTCPKCAKKYGHNFIVVLAEI